MSAIVCFFGQKLAQPKIPEHAFSEWIRTDSSEEFELLAKRLESLTDIATAKAVRTLRLRERAAHFWSLSGVETSASRVHFDGVYPLALRLRERINAAVGLWGPNRLGDCYKYAVLTPKLEATYRYAMLCERDFFQAAWESE